MFLKRDLRSQVMELSNWGWEALMEVAAEKAFRWAPDVCSADGNRFL